MISRNVPALVPSGFQFHARCRSFTVLGATDFHTPTHTFPKDGGTPLSRLSSVPVSDLAMEWLERAADERNMGFYSRSADPIYDPIRATPRFKKLTDRIHISPIDAASETARSDVR